MKNALCVYHVVLDNDKAGKDAYEKAEDDGYVAIKNTTFVTCRGMAESEFEDCLNKDIYKDRVVNEFGVNLDCSKFRNNRSKWSDRVKNVFLDQGKKWDSSVEKLVKLLVAEAIKRDPHNALNANKRNSIDALISSLEEMIKQ